MKLHYKGKYDLNPESLPHGEHKPGAVRFKEAKDTKELGVIANVLCLVIIIVLAVSGNAGSLRDRNGCGRLL